MSSSMKALKYIAVWIAFVLYHTNTAAAHQCAKCSADYPMAMLDKSERRIFAALVCFVLASVIALAALSFL